jgi:hypothetical protein
VYAGDERIAERSSGFLARLFGGGWPDPDAVVAALRARLAAGRTAGAERARAPRAG